MDENDGIFVPNVPLFAADQMIDSMSGFARISATLALKTLQEPAFKRLTAHEYLWGYRDRISALQFAAGKSQFGLLKNVSNETRNRKRRSRRNILIFKIVFFFYSSVMEQVSIPCKLIPVKMT